jgi:hypothetical protein
MSNNISYRVRTEVNKDKFVSVNLTEKFDELNILSLKIDTANTYKLHTSKYGCLVGRVLANGGVGIPNAKVSVFISAGTEALTDPVLAYLYPYSNVRDTNKQGLRYNLLPTSVNDKCHQDIGSFPNKRMVLDDNNVIEIYDKYYKFTTTTNAAGDYMIFGLPTGNNIIHSELDLSDIGILSQKPRDLYYKGYNETQFENSSQFKKDTNLDSLTQVISQDDSVYVYPFWGDDEVDVEGAESQIKITRNDINISYKFEPTCIFIGSIVADEKSQGFSKKCVPTTRMGKMDRLTTGKGTIEMIRKTPLGDIESFTVQGNDLIDGNGTWCYQIPMNLDYVKTDEFGNLVAAENETVGIPTRASVRFRVSLADYESDSANAHLVKMLVPNNPDKIDTTLKLPITNENGEIGYKEVEVKNKYVPDYAFGSETRDDSFRDLLWNNVYTVKQYIPRLQKIRSGGLSRKRIDRNKNFSGIKAVNVNGSNNPIPYNNIRVQLTFLFMFQCIIFKALILIVKALNLLVYITAVLTCGKSASSRTLEETSSADSSSCSFTNLFTRECKFNQNDNSCDVMKTLRYITIDGAMCPQTDGWYFAFGSKATDGSSKKASLIYNTVVWAEQDSVNHGTASCKPCTCSCGNSGIGTGDSNLADNGGGNLSESDTDSTISADIGKEDTSKNGDKYSAEKKYKMKITGGADDNGTYVSSSEAFFVKCVELQFAMEYEVIQFDFYNDWLNGCLYFPRWFAELKKRRKTSKIIACDNNFSGDKIMMVQQCAVGYKAESVVNLSVYSDYTKTYNGCGGEKTKCHQGGGRKGRYILNADGYSHGGVVRFVRNMNDKFLYYLRPIEVTNDATDKICNLYATDIVLLGNVNECNQYGIPEAKGYPSSTFIMPPPTIQIEDESQEGELSKQKQVTFYGTSNNTTKYFYDINGLNSSGDTTGLTEFAGIDWGYNPFETSGSVSGDESYKIKKQRPGHFLEIGCTNSMTNVKSCINLQRICELGAEMSQSHEYGTDSKIHVSGIVGNREVIGDGIRTVFASLNSNKLKFNKINNNYIYNGLIPKSFDGVFSGFNGVCINDYTNETLYKLGFIETKSNSYLNFRYGTTTFPAMKFTFKFEDDKGDVIYKAMPITENSFYFYFGLHDGNTAIDRLYTEYFSDCNSGEVSYYEVEDGSTSIIK